MISQKTRISSIACLGFILSSTATYAREQGNSSSVAKPSTASGDDTTNDIVVVARRRGENLMQVPVVVSVITSDEIERRGLTSFDDIGSITPGLIITDSAGSTQGGLIAIRGISTGDTNPFADQAVSFNIDGAQVGRSSVRRMAQMDIEQVEILKGPQALFFGKNSPGGIIVVRTADPTPQFSSKMTVGYETDARMLSADGHISGPLAPWLSGRLAVYTAQGSGFLKNVATPSASFGPARTRLPRTREFAGRLTLKASPSEDFDARLKINYGKLRTSGPASTLQLVNCPLGAPQLGGVNECNADDETVRSDYGPAISAIQPKFPDQSTHHGFGDGEPYFRQAQVLSSIELNYRPTDTLTLTSLTSYYRVRAERNDSFTAIDTVTPAVQLASYGYFKVDELSEELRLASDFDGRFNFLVGGYAQKTRLFTLSLVALNALSPIIVNNSIAARQRGRAYSAFAQATYDITDTIELAGGGRYSYEKKSFQPYAGGAEVATVKPRDNWNNISPEVTLTWRPTNRLTVFAAYKQGFLSGGFNSGASNYALDQSYDQQKIKGFEGGVKTVLGDNQLHFNLSAYHYKVYGLQISLLTNGTIQTVINAGKATTKGVEFDATWNTPVEGLAFNAAASYTNARYNEFITGCYVGQTFALGCNRNQNVVTGLYTAQDLAGAQLARAPDWNVFLGARYDKNLSASYKVGLTFDSKYTSGFFTDSQNRPTGHQPGYWLLDASVRAVNEDLGVELALIGRNLTNKRYFQYSVPVPFTGAGTGGTGVPRIADTFADVQQGRQLLLRLSVQLGRGRP